MCGVEGKIQKMAFTAAKDKIVKDYLEKNLNKYTTEEAKKDKIPLETSIVDEIEISNKINTTHTSINNYIQEIEIIEPKIDTIQVAKKEIKDNLEINTADMAKNIEIKKIYKNM